METLQSTLLTVDGRKLRKGLKVKIVAKNNKFKVISAKTGKSYSVTETNLVNSLLFTEKTTVKAFVNSIKKPLPFSKIRLESVVANAVGNEITPKNKYKAIEAVNNFIGNKQSNITCPRCQTNMIITTLASDLKAWYCPNDRVTLPCIEENL